jgi:hypothetical protein
MSRPHPRFVLLFTALVAIPVVAAADDLPPNVAPAYSAVYHNTSRARDKAQDEWTYHSEDTITISILPSRLSRWDYKSDGHWLLNDQVSRRSTTFGGKNPPNTAYSFQAPYLPLGWEFGYDTAAKVSDSKPEVLGKTTIAGKECTQVKLVSEQYGEPEYCVTKTGIVLRFVNKSSTAETVYEAQSVDESAPDQKRFSTPPGTRVEERGGPRRPKIL